MRKNNIPAFRTSIESNFAYKSLRPLTTSEGIAIVGIVEGSETGFCSMDNLCNTLISWSSGKLASKIKSA